MFSHSFKIDPSPDFNRLLKVLTRDGIPDRVPFYELFSNIESEVLIHLGKISAGQIPPSGTPERARWDLQQHLTYMFTLGYDYVNVRATNFYFPQKARPMTMTAQGARGYLAGSSCTIANRRDFESYP